MHYARHRIAFSPSPHSAARSTTPQIRQVRGRAVAFVFLLLCAFVCIVTSARFEDGLSSEGPSGPVCGRDSLPSLRFGSRLPGGGQESLQEERHEKGFHGVV